MAGAVTRSLPLGDRTASPVRARQHYGVTFMPSVSEPVRASQPALTRSEISTDLNSAVPVRWGETRVTLASLSALVANRMRLPIQVPLWSVATWGCQLVILEAMQSARPSRRPFASPLSQHRRDRGWPPMGREHHEGSLSGAERASADRNPSGRNSSVLTI